jgi:calcium-dependent protein kinase
LSTLDHPNIVKYYETYEDVKYIYLVMELCLGGELMEKLSERQSPFSESEAANIIEKLIRAIIHCNSANITHRDIKPENIMFDNDGEVKLIDFGLAKQTNKKNQKMHTVAGTPYFIAPEVLNGEYGKECDVWSYGVVLYLMLSAAYPFDGNNRAEVFGKI